MSQIDKTTDCAPLFAPVFLFELTESLGGVGDTPYLHGLADWPDVVPIIKEADEQSPHSFGAGWHTDFTFQPQPPSRTLAAAAADAHAGCRGRRRGRVAAEAAAAPWLRPRQVKSYFLQCTIFTMYSETPLPELQKNGSLSIKIRTG